MKKVTDAKVKNWLSQNIFKYRPWVIALTVITVLSTICSVGFAYLSSFLIDSATAKNTTRLLTFAFIVLGLLLARIALRAINGYYTEKCRATIVTELRGKLFKKVLKSNYASIKDYHSGDVVTRITADTAEIAGTSVNIMPQTVGMIIQLLGAVVALFAIDGLFTLFLLAGGVLVIAISAFLRKKTKWYYKEIVKADGESRSFMQESVLSSLTVKAYGAEEKTSLKANSILDGYKRRRLGRAKLNSLVGVLYSIITNLGLVFAIIWCSFGIMEGMSYGAVLSIVLLMEQLQRPLNTASAIMPAYYSRQASVERLLEIDSLEQESTFTACPIDYENVCGITFEDVSFSYDRDVILNKLNIKFEKGKLTCIKGVSGVGKSTLFKLLLGAYKPEEGKIWVDCTDDRKEVCSESRGLFAYVPQGNFLFSGTIYENLTFFAKETDREKLSEKVNIAIKDACAEFVYELPNGLDTILTEQGGGLSEGQRQRLAVARAFISERPILLLDEATSALDEQTEEKLIQNVRAMKDKTCIIISHRQAVIDQSDTSIKL